MHLINHSAWRPAVLLSLAAVAGLHAQGTVPPRTYIFSIRNYGFPPATDLAAVIGSTGGNTTVVVDYPEAQSSFIIASMRPAQMGAIVNSYAAGEVFAEEDQALEPDGAGSTGPYSNTVPTNYALNKVAGTNVPAPPCRSPVRFIGIDSGIRYPLGDFPATRITFATPWLPPTVITPIGGPAIPSLPGVWAGTPTGDADELDHGTGVISCAVGSQAGVLGRVPSIPAVVQSFRIHRLGACAALASDAIQALARAAQEEALRKLDGTLGNDGTVITFPYRTVCGVSYGIDHQIWKAARAGALVVCGTGNYNVAAEPSIVAGYPGADPDLDVSCSYNLPPVAPGSPARMGPLVPRSPACTISPCPPWFVFAGGSDATDARWMASASSGSNYSIETDVFAPASAVPVASSTALVAYHLVSGTSFSCGYTAGNASYYLTQRPWAMPEEVRAWLMTQTSVPPPVTIPVSPSGSRYRLSLPNKMPVDCCLGYAAWAAEHRLPAASSAASADHDGDGLTNLAEYGVGSNPRASTPSAGISIHTVSGVSYLRAARAFWLNGECGATWRVQSSTNLMTWTDITAGFTKISPELRDNDGALYQSNTPIPAEGVRTYYRVSVTIP